MRLRMCRSQERVTRRNRNQSSSALLFSDMIFGRFHAFLFIFVVVDVTDCTETRNVLMSHTSITGVRTVPTANNIGMLPYLSRLGMSLRLLDSFIL